MAKIFDARVGGAGSGMSGGLVALPAGACDPARGPGCCDAGLPDAASVVDQYFRRLNFSGDQRLMCLCGDKLQAFADGDGFLLTGLYAGLPIDKIIYDNRHGCAGLEFHYELHDLATLLNSPTSTAELVLPAVDIVGSASKYGIIDIAAANGDKSYFGDPYGTDGGTPAKPCKKHKGLVLVIDKKPTTTDVPTPGCPTCDYAGSACAEDCCPLKCINIGTWVPTFVPQGLEMI
jgi:hypothetical protein